MAFTNSQLAQKISDLIGYWTSYITEYADWLGGSSSGGPSSDGLYPLTDWQGNESLVKSPAKLQEDVDDQVSSASASAAAAATSETNAATSATTATTQEGLADTARIAAELAETNAVTAEASAVNEAVTATAQAAAALASATNAATSETNAATSETNAAASAAAALASELAAATFDPADFYLRTALDGGQLDDRYYTETEVDATFANYTLTSGLSISDWDTAFSWGDHASGGYAASVHTHDRQDIYDARADGDVNPDALPTGNLYTTFTDDITGSPNVWDSVLNVRGWGTTYRVWQLMSNSGDDDTNDNLYFRSGRSTTWGDLRKVWDDSHFATSQVTNWDTAYGWGDHALGGYAVSAHSHVIADVSDFTDNSTNWDAAYGWGDHASLYSLLAHTHDGITDTNLLDKSAVETIGGVWTFNGIPVAKKITSTAANTRDKYRVWTNSTYTIGMQNSITFGGIDNSYAMTFQFSDTATRGFWWGDLTHTTAQGAMAVTTEGKLTVAHSLRLGYGESDITIPGATYVLDVSGDGNISGGLTVGGTAFVSSDIANWNTAYGWGDHAGLYESADTDIVKADVEETIGAAWDFTAAPTKSALGIPYYVTASYAGGKITVSSSAPGSPAQGDIWFDTT